MSDSQKYYYLKLKEDFYDRPEIKVIESLPNGYKYSNILLKMYLKSLSRGGKLMITDIIPYEINTLAAVVGHDVDIVRTAIEIFSKFGLIESLSSGEIYMTEIQNFIGKSSTEADRKRAYRERIDQEATVSVLPEGQYEIGQISDKCPDISPPEIEKELETKKEINNSRQKTKFSDLHLELANLLLGKIKENNPEHVLRGNIESWANDIRLMMERDGRSEEHVRNMIDWSQNDSFWQSNILSAAKLREKYDTMKAQAKRKGGNSNGTHRNGAGQNAPEVSGKEAGVFSEYGKVDNIPEKYKNRSRSSGN